MMYLITDTRTTTVTDEETKELKPHHVTEVNLQYQRAGVLQLLEKKKLGDNAAANCRVFELSLGDDGVPKVGKELQPE